MRIGGNANGGLIKVSSDPDGTLTAQRGTSAIDTTTGIRWVNRAGGTRWDPEYIPDLWGRKDFFDFDAQTYASTTAGTGTASDASGTAILAGRLGVRRFTVSAAGTDLSSARSSNSSACYPTIGRFVFRAAVEIPTLSDGTDRLCVRVGGGNSTTFADHTNGVYFEYDLAGNSSSNWFLCTANNGTGTKTDTGIAPIAGVYQNLEIRVNAAGTSVAGEIDGVACATAVTTNIPNAAGRAFSPAVLHVTKKLGATARSVDIDWFGYYQVLTVARGL